MAAAKLIQAVSHGSCFHDLHQAAAFRRQSQSEVEDNPSKELPRPPGIGVKNFRWKRKGEDPGAASLFQPRPKSFTRHKTLASCENSERLRDRSPHPLGEVSSL